MIKARASGSKVYLYFMKKGRQARHRIPRNSCSETVKSKLTISVFETVRLSVLLSPRNLHKSLKSIKENVMFPTESFYTSHSKLLK